MGEQKTRNELEQRVKNAKWNSEGGKKREMIWLTEWKNAKWNSMEYEKREIEWVNGIKTRLSH